MERLEPIEGFKKELELVKSEPEEITIKDEPLGITINDIVDWDEAEQDEKGVEPLGSLVPNNVKSAGSTGNIKQCPYCPYQTLWNLESHIYCYHTDPSELNWFYCDQCDKKFKQKSSLKVHVTTVHLEKDKPYSCKTCNKKFKKRNNLRKHMLLVHQKLKGRYKCDKCPYKTDSQFSFNIHSTDKHADEGELPMLKCSSCDFETKFWRVLYSHMWQTTHNVTNLDQHTGLYTLQHNHQESDTIEESNNIEKVVESSEYRHKTNTPFVRKLKVLNCKLCDFKTIRKSSLQEHSLEHKTLEDIKLQKCAQCTFSSKNKYRLRAHTQKVHNKKEPDYLRDGLYVCDKCSYKSSYKKKLMSHMEHHRNLEDGNHFECEICKFKTKTEQSMIKHVASHKESSVYECSKCSFTTQVKDDLKKHSEEHSEVAATAVVFLKEDRLEMEDYDTE